jgi:hypothetical protein
MAGFWRKCADQQRHKKHPPKHFIAIVSSQPTPFITGHSLEIDDLEAVHKADGNSE